MYTISFNGLQFPVPPEKLKLSVKNQNKTLNLVSGMELNIPKVPGLTEISFELLLPAVRYPFADYPDGFHTPDFYTNALKELKQGKKPFSFIVNRKLPNGQPSFDTQMTVLLEEYSLNEDAGSGFDVRADIKLKEYMGYGVLPVENVQENADGTMLTAGSKKRKGGKEAASTYTVKNGDTLWNICRRELGSESEYSRVVQLNQLDNPNEIIPGQVIRLA